MFNHILHSTGYEFKERSRRPPKDAINAMISFGNTILYNYFLHIIWKTSLDPRIGIVHATNNRSHSLNLDFADIFKPIVVDRVIFSLINTHQLKADIHFEKSKEGGVYLSNAGKRIFIEQFEQKMSDVLAIDGINYTYKRLMHREVN